MATTEANLSTQQLNVSDEVDNSAKKTKSCPAGKRKRRQCPSQDSTPEGKEPKKRIKRKSTKTFNCNKCDYTTNENYLLRSHMYRHSSERTMPCPQCDMLFKNRIHLRRHIQNRHTNREVSCNYCQKVVKSHIILHSHVSAFHPETLEDHGLRQYECYVCHKTFVAQAIIKRHFYERHVYMRDKSFLCSKCGISMRSRRELERHMMRLDHNLDGSLIKPFACEYCEKSFATKFQLAEHTPTHTGEKAFACQLCGKLFASSNNLRKHKLTHMEARHHCTLCEHKCRSRGNLQKHMRVHLKQ